MNKVYLSVIATLVAVLLGVGYLWQQSIDEVAYLKIENKSFSEALERAGRREKRDSDILVAREAENALQARKLAQAQGALSKALQRNKAWSDTDVPPDVQSALGGASDGLAGVLQQTPNPRP